MKKILLLLIIAMCMAFVSAEQITYGKEITIFVDQTGLHNVSFNFGFDAGLGDYRFVGFEFDNIVYPGHYLTLTGDHDHKGNNRYILFGRWMYNLELQLEVENLPVNDVTHGNFIFEKIDGSREFIPAHLIRTDRINLGFRITNDLITGEWDRIETEVTNPYNHIFEDARIYARLIDNQGNVVAQGNPGGGLDVQANGTTTLLTPFTPMNTPQDFTAELRFNLLNANDQIVTLPLTLRNPRQSMELTTIDSLDQKGNYNFDFNIQNTGDSILENLEIEVEALNSQVTHDFVKSTIDLAIGQNQTFTVSGINNVDYGDLLKVEISNENLSEEKIININPGNRLVFEELTLYVNEEKDRIKSSGRKFGTEIKPGSEIKLIAEICNEYPRSSDIEIRDVEINGEIKDINDGSDIDVDTSSFDIEAGECEEVEIDLDENEISLDAESDTYELQLELSAEDSIDQIHTTTFTAKMKIDRKKEEAYIEGIGTQGTSCEAIKLGAKLINIGERDFAGELRVYSNYFDQAKEINIRNYEDGTPEESVNFNIKTNVNGQIPVIAELTQNGYLIDSKEFTVKKSSCATEVEFEEIKPIVLNDVSDKVDKLESLLETMKESKTTVTKSDSTPIWPLAAMGGIAVITMLIGGVLILRRKGL